MTLELSLMEPAEVEATLAVVQRSFDASVAPDYAQEGRERFARVINTEYLQSLPHRQGFTLIAKQDGRAVGMFAIRDLSHITLFFVLPEMHGRGIGRKLFNAALERVLRNEPLPGKLQVHSSPFGVPIYEALGFSAIGPEEVEGGIRYIPMERLLL
jgi:GNAT superfamily N-acetyltransferase